MTKPNSARARKACEDAIAGSAEGKDYPAFPHWKEQARGALRLVYDEGADELTRFDKLSFAPGIWTDGTPRSHFDAARHRDAESVVGMLKAALVFIDASDPAAPTVDVAGLHPWVAATASLWDGGQHRVAVSEACRNVEVNLRAKLGVEGTLTNLVQSGFSPNPPADGSPRLRRSGFEPGSESWQNAHKGALSFGQGVAMAVRNLYAHGAEPSEQEALEALAAVSLLARWVDEATVERA